MNLIEIKQKLMNHVIVFGGKGFDATDCDFDEGQKSRVIDVVDESFDDTPDGLLFVLHVDFSEFEDFNKELSQPVWSDKNEKFSLRWHETSYYPKNCRTTVYVGGDEKSWPFRDEHDGKALVKVVLTAADWNKLVDKFGKAAIDELGIKPI